MTAAFRPSRRTFVKTVSAGLAAGVAAGGFHSALNARDDNKKSLGVALVGLGSLSTKQIAPALQKTGNCHLAGIVTGTPEKEQTWAAKYNIDRSHIYSYESFDKIVGDETIDIVYVVLPNSMHEEFTIRAAKAGKHVFCEKPMANSVAECQRMIDACKSADRQLAIGYRCQFEPHHQRCIELASSKELGNMRLIDAGFGFKIGDPKQWRLNKKLAGGGALMDVGIYALQACRYLTGEEPISVTAQETKTDAEKFAQVDESITWTMKFPSGVLAQCSTSYSFSGLNRFKVFSDNGFIQLDPAFGYTGIQGESSKGPIKFDQVDAFQLELQDFANCVLENKKSRVAGEEGLKDLKVVEAIYQSIREGKTVATS
jgi:predicted dehydrogenase